MSKGSTNYDDFKRPLPAGTKEFAAPGVQLTKVFSFSKIFPFIFEHIEVDLRVFSYFHFFHLFLTFRQRTVKEIQRLDPKMSGKNCLARHIRYVA